MNLFPKSLNLWVSLPHNEPELAQAALEAGADVLKVHIAADHFASGTRFGTLEEEGERIAQIIAAAKDKPVGIVPGDALEVMPRISCAEGFGPVLCLRARIIYRCAG